MADTGLPASAGVCVTVVRAWPNTLWQRELALPAGATLGDALAACDLGAQWPGFNPWLHGVGVFGLLRPASYVLRDGDRVEMYRPLDFDPMESRRRRARHKAARVQAKSPVR